MADYGFIAQGVNPVDQLGKLATVQNAVNENRLFQGRQAAGQAAQQSVGPDGQVDYNRAASLVSQNKLIAPYALQALGELQTQRGQQISNTTGQTSLQAAYAQNLRKVIASVPPGANQPQQVISAINKGVQMGLYPGDIAASFVGGQSLNDGTTMADLVKQAAIGSGDASAQSAQFGDAVNIDNGSNIQPTAINRVAGTTAPIGAPIAKTLTPESKAAPRNVTNQATGIAEQVPTSALVTDTGEPRPNVAGLTGPHGETQSSLAPGVGEAAVTAGQGAAALLNTDRADQAQSAQRLTVLKHVNDLLATPEGKTGPGTQVVNGWRSFLLANAPLVASLSNGGVDEAKLRTATQDELKKYMVQVAGSAAAQYGPGTNEKLAVAASGNANPDLSTLANQDVTRMNIALERAKQARIAAWDASGQSPQGYGAFVSGWNRTHDPRAFMLDLLSKDERAKMLGGVASDADKRALLMGKKAAEDAGLYSEKDIPR